MIYDIEFPADARVLYSPNINISPYAHRPQWPVFEKIKTIEVTFIYEPKK